MRVTHLFAGLAVADFAAARDWYERLFGCPPDSVPKDGEAIWRPSPSASVYITVDRARAGHGLLTLAVTSLAGLTTDLARLGIPFDEGELFVVPRGVEHCPKADEEALVLLIEPRGTRNTGEIETALTAVEVEI